MKPVERLALELSAAHALPYDGLDASVAPSPAAPSLTDAYASLGLGRFGESGTLAVSALLTGALKALDLKLCGYTGLMLPPLEDTGLARRATEGGYRIHDLLLNSAVCGLGLDTVLLAPAPAPSPAPRAVSLRSTPRRAPCGRCLCRATCQRRSSRRCSSTSRRWPTA